MQTPLLNTKEAAKFLGVSAAFLERDRWAGHASHLSKSAAGLCGIACQT